MVAEAFVEDALVAKKFTESIVVAVIVTDDTSLAETLVCDKLAPKSANEDAPVPPLLTPTTSEAVNSAKADGALLLSKSNLRGILSPTVI